MGKKRIVKKSGGGVDKGKISRSLSRVSKRNIGSGVLYVRSTYNNTKLLLANKKGDALAWSSSGSLGFKGAKKGTPFAAAKVGEIIGDKAMLMGIKEANVVVKGIGPGRESSIRAFAAKGVNLSSIKDETPVPHNGPRQKKPRRV